MRHQRVTQLIADPDKCAPHTTGGAVDVTLVHSTTGQELAMGTAIDEIESELIYFWHPGLTPEQRRNRLILYTALRQAGFINSPHTERIYGSVNLSIPVILIFMTPAHTEDYWKHKLTPEQYRVLRDHGTEPAFSGQYYDRHDPGMYQCTACDQELFSSNTKFDSDTGWPSFDNPANTEHVELREDSSLGMVRTEVLCKNCGSHLGHVFDDGPTATGKRYCINSVCLRFKPKK